MTPIPFLLLGGVTLLLAALVRGRDDVPAYVPKVLLGAGLVCLGVSIVLSGIVVGRG